LTLKSRKPNTGAGFQQCPYQFQGALIDKRNNQHENQRSTRRGKNMAGRPSKLTEAQWGEVLRQVMIDKRPMRDVAKEFGISAASVHKRISERSETVKEAAVARIEADKKMDALPVIEQIVAKDFANSLRDISKSLCEAAATGARNASRLSAMAALQLDGIDPCSPLESADRLQAASGLTKLANESASMGMGLLNANKKDTPIDPPMKALPLSAFYGKVKK
jgi:hypothetical protein